MAEKKYTEESTMDADLKRLQIEEQKLRLRDLQEQIDERELKKSDREMKRKMNGAQIKQENKDYRERETRCNHRKGGQGLQGLNGDGDNAADHALIRFQMMNGDIWQRCLRCAKLWRPPVRSGCKDQAEYDAKMQEYRNGMALPTKNTTAGSLVCSFSDGGEVLRETLKHTNLR